ncbi:hypothetical protein Q9S36_14790 [Microbacterium sp. ARD31]|uniref:hypothetical protein n=1 Tax=Microbacterium sp. ARD31 TaxID=2962576 RepID=UPI0028824417|nr:hypothetical protein [Microbacterium sp. ARD31]MDT0181447.1 hypothetical protein [Microbacterium sp. ARD31]
MNERWWYNLVAESQFATELVRSGIARVCSLPMSADRPGGQVGCDETYPLNVGLHMYTSGLERLCKLALACHGFATTGEFPKVRKYSHKLSGLLKAIEDLDMSAFKPYYPEYLKRPGDEFGDELVEWLERYASGDGRYELLDSLTRDDVEILTWDVWVQFCSRGVVSDDVKESISIRYAMGEALGNVTVANDLESVAYPFWESTSRSFHAPAVAVGLAMYRRARWAAEIIGATTHYTGKGLPILREVVNVLTQTTDNFFTYEVAGISDREPVVEELTRHFESFIPPEDEEGVDWADEEQLDTQPVTPDSADHQ